MKLVASLLCKSDKLIIRGSNRVTHTVHVHDTTRDLMTEQKTITALGGWAALTMLTGWTTRKRENRGIFY
jgi:hypothetical protein